MGLGSRTMAFFRKGEELEATEYENLPYNDPSLVPPKLGFRDFDRVPRNYKPLAIAVVLIVVGVLGVLGSVCSPCDGSCRRCGIGLLAPLTA